MLRRAPTRVEIKNDDLEELAAAARARLPPHLSTQLQESFEAKPGNTAQRERIGITQDRR